MLETRKKLLEHFDDEVRARFRVIGKRMKEDLSTLDTMLARLVISALNIKNYEVSGGVCRMFIGQNEPTGGDKPRPYEMKKIHPGWYYIGRYIETGGERLHVGHHAAKSAIEHVKKKSLELQAVRFCYTKGGHRITQLEPYLGKTGAWFAFRLSFEGLDTEGASCPYRLREGSQRMDSSG